MHNINVPPLRKALEYVTDHPEEHNQLTWAQRRSCGTTGCLAYHIAVIAGHEARWGDFTWDNAQAAYHVTTGETIKVVAAREIGLDLIQSDLLFAGSNSVDRLWELAAEFTDGEIAREPSEGTTPA